jgi:transposase-like protein
MDRRVSNWFRAMSKLSKAHLHDEKKAIKKLETILWPDGPLCPRCKGQTRISKVGVETARPGLWRCGPCKRQFTVTIGTLFERSHVPMHLWFQAVYLMAASKKGFSACQLERFPIRMHHIRQQRSSFGIRLQ